MSSGTKVFTNESLYVYYKLRWWKCKRSFLEKRIASFWVKNGAVKIKLLNDQVRSITYKVDLLGLTHEGPLDGTDRNIVLLVNLYSSWFKLYRSILYRSMLKAIFERTKVFKFCWVIYIKVFSGILLHSAPGLLLFCQLCRYKFYCIID